MSAEYRREQINAAVVEWLRTLFPGRIHRARTAAISMGELPALLIRRTAESREWPWRILAIDIRILAAGAPIDAAADDVLQTIESHVVDLRKLLPGTRIAMDSLSWDLDGDTEADTVEASLPMTIKYQMVGDQPI